MTTFATTIDEFLQTFRNGDFVHERMLVATKDDSDEVLGTVGFSINGSAYTNLSFWELTKRRGFTTGLAAYFVGSILMSEKAKSDELYVASIAVSPNSRGLGVGSVLMDAMEEFAVAEQKKQLRLHVIDENPEARRLYERLGYKVVKTLSVGPLYYVLGFKKAHEMVKPLN
jgi:ribosomal protein S18 acetylase RimI-like enzyme